MTLEDAAKAIGGILLSVLSAITGWLFKRVLDDREDLILLKSKVEGLEKDQAAQVTQECVREAVEEALDRRDKQAAERRVEWDRRQALEIKQAVGEEMEKMMPKIIREVRAAATGRRSLPSDQGSASP